MGNVLAGLYFGNLNIFAQQRSFSWKQRDLFHGNREIFFMETERSFSWKQRDLFHGNRDIFFMETERSFSWKQRDLFHGNRDLFHGNRDIFFMETEISFSWKQILFLADCLHALRLEPLIHCIPGTHRYSYPIIINSNMS